MEHGFLPEVHSKETLVLIPQPWKRHLKLEILSKLRSEFYLEPGKLGRTGRSHRLGQRRWEVPGMG